MLPVSAAISLFWFLHLSAPLFWFTALIRVFFTDKSTTPRVHYLAGCSGWLQTVYHLLQSAVRTEHWLVGLLLCILLDHTLHLQTVCVPNWYRALWQLPWWICTHTTFAVCVQCKETHSLQSKLEHRYYIHAQKPLSLSLLSIQHPPPDCSASTLIMSLPWKLCWDHRSAAVNLLKEKGDLKWRLDFIIYSYSLTCDGQCSVFWGVGAVTVNMCATIFFSTEVFLFSFFF